MMSHTPLMFFVFIIYIAVYLLTLPITTVLFSHMACKDENINHMNSSNDLLSYCFMV